jgi:hypothetical protein
VNLPPGGKYHTKVYFLGRNVEPERRIWALDSTMVQRGPSGIWIDKTFFEAPFDDLEYRLSLHSNKLTVGDYQADYVIGDDQLYNPVFQTTVDTNGGVWKMIPNPTPWAHTVIYDDGQ